MALAPQIGTFGDPTHASGETGQIVTGGGFGGSPGEVWMYQYPNQTGLADKLTVGAWGDTLLTGIDLPSITNNVIGTVYLFVIRDDLAASDGFAFTLATATTPGNTVDDFLEGLYIDELSDLFGGNRTNKEEPRARLLPLINTGLLYAYATYKIAYATTTLQLSKATKVYTLPEQDVLAITKIFDANGFELASSAYNILGKVISFPHPEDAVLTVEYKTRPPRFTIDQDDSQVVLVLPEMLLCWLRAYVAGKYLAPMKTEQSVAKSVDFLTQAALYEQIYINTNTTNEYSSQETERLYRRGFP